MHEADTLQRFLFEHSNVRGEFIHLGASYQAVRQRYDYPEQVAQQLGQALAASTLLSATLKFEGSLIMQIQSTGPINMLVAQCTHDRHLRGLARWQEGSNLNGQSLTEQYGKGRIVITINTKRSEDRYQGVVALEGTNLAAALSGYFMQSEQLDTKLWLAADQNQAVGMLLQRLPGDDNDDNNEMWDRIDALGSTITEQELLALPSTEILHRLFHEETVRLFDPEPASFRCDCSRDKIITVIRSLGLDDAHALIEEQGQIEAACEFCNQHYTFDQVDVEEVFATTTPVATDTSKTQH